MGHVRLGASAIVLAVAALVATAVNRVILHVALPEHLSPAADVVALLVLLGGAWLMLRSGSDGSRALKTLAEVGGIFLALTGTILGTLGLGILYGVLSPNAVLPPAALVRYQAAYSANPVQTDLLLGILPVVVGLLGVLLAVLGLRQPSAPPRRP